MEKNIYQIWAFVGTIALSVVALWAMQSQSNLYSEYAHIYAT